MADSNTQAQVQAQDQAQAQARFLNPWVLHIQKLGLELKCPVCLKLYNKPLLLPCNHIFCSSCVPKSNLHGSECPLCKMSYIEQDLREAPYMENLVNIYRSLDASFSTHMLNSVGNGSVQCSFPAKTSVSDQLPKLPIDSSPGNSTSETTNVSLRGSERVQMLSNPLAMSKLERCSGFGNPGPRPMISEQDVSRNVDSFSQRPAQLEQHVAVDVYNPMVMSPDSPPSSGASKGIEIDSRDPLSSDETAGKCLKKTEKRAVNALGVQGISEHNDSYCKKQKMNQSLPQSPQLQKKASASSDTNFRAMSVDHLAVESDSVGVPNFSCAFCQRWKITAGSGAMHHFVNGKQVSDHEAGRSNVMHLHQNCIEWAPQVYYKDDTTLGNLDKELARAGKLKCTSCGLKGAALGCFAKLCRRTYHAPCAYEITECRWDTEDYLMFCPAHASYKFPSEKSRKPAAKKSASPAIYNEQKNLCDPDFWAESPAGAENWVFCGSSLSSDEKFMLAKFANLCGATVVKSWTPDVTHVIAATDANGAYSRTLKVLMAILKGKWIVKADWVKACIQMKHPVDEEPYEINVDNHGCFDAPKSGRIWAQSNAPKLFSSLKFYFNGDFVPAYREDLQDLILAAGGTVFKSKEQLLQSRFYPSTTLVVYNEDAVMDSGEVANVLQRQVEAEMVAAESGSEVIPHTWILDSIASYKLKPFVQNNSL